MSDKPITHGAPWTDETDRQIVALRRKGWTNGEIGDFMGRTEDAVKTRLDKLARRGVTVPPASRKKAYTRHESPAPAPKYTMRACMRCGKAFRSEGPHHRLCGCQRGIYVSPYEI